MISAVNWENSELHQRIKLLVLQLERVFKNVNMKTRNSKILFFIFLLSLTMGCKKTLDVNQNPNAPALSQASPRLLFPSAVMAVAAREGGDLAILGAIWGQYAAQSNVANQYRYIEAYNVRSTDLQSPYTGLFTGGLKNFQYIIDNSRQSADWNFFLMGWVMKAYTAGLLVDLYDQIPYFEALQGSQNLNPRFDQGYAIYEDLLKGLDSAVAVNLTASTNTAPGSADIVFNGDMNRWIQFANTLELKLYLRMVNAKPQEAQAGVQKIYARNASFLTTDAGVTGFTNAPGRGNPLWEQDVRSLGINNLRASTTFASFLRANNDPRAISYFGTSNVTSINQGDYLSNNTAYSSATPLVESPTAPVVFISAAESYFLQAEARERYFGGNNAQQLYNQGVITAFSEVGQNGTSFVASGGPYAYPSTGTLEQKIEAISTQKWAHFPYGNHYIEGFFEKQRTGYPRTSTVYSTSASYVPGQFVTSPNSVLPAGQLPRRLVFPDVEVSRNTNTPAQIPITTPVWWARP
jgi:hypothetical protein